MSEQSRQNHLMFTRTAFNHISNGYFPTDQATLDGIKSRIDIAGGDIRIFDPCCGEGICNPELVKTGLDLLAFPTIYFMQTGYNVYTLMQAARRSWRIGQQQDVEVYFAGYRDSAQQICLELMGKKIAVTQSTSGDMPDSGLDILNQSEDSVEVELAKRLIEHEQTV